MISYHLPMLHFGYDRQVTSCLVWIWTSDTLSPYPCISRHRMFLSSGKKIFILSFLGVSLFTLCQKWLTNFLLRLRAVFRHLLWRLPVTWHGGSSGVYIDLSASSTEKTADGGSNGYQTGSPSIVHVFHLTDFLLETFYNLYIIQTKSLIKNEVSWWNMYNVIIKTCDTGILLSNVLSFKTNNFKYFPFDF